MNFITLFSGIGAPEEALIPLGWDLIAVAEIEPFPASVLRHYHPNVPNLGDVKRITEERIKALGHIDAVVFGFPCQDLSVAGKRAGLKGERSGLFFDAMRIVRWAGARWAIAENVPGLFSSEEGRDFAAVVGEMVGMELDVPAAGWQNIGVASGPDGLCEWAVLDAQWFGVPQRRRRVFLIRDTGDWFSRGPVLFERDCLSGYPPPRREARKGITGGVANSIGGSSQSGGFRTTDLDNQGAFIAKIVNQAMSSKWSKGTSGPAGDEVANLIAHSLRADGFDASEDGTGRVTPIVPTIAPCLTQNYGKQPDNSDPNASPMLISFSAKDHGADAMEDCSPMLRSCGDYGVNGGPMPAVAVRTANTGANGHGVAENVSHALDGAQGQAVAFQSSQSGVREVEARATLDSNNGSRRHNGVMQGMAVRRLTPRECERLQGFPDNYTLIQYKGKPAADGPRYKALGNAMAVPVMAWLGKRIHMVEGL